MQPVRRLVKLLVITVCIISSIVISKLPVINRSKGTKCPDKLALQSCY